MAQESKETPKSAAAKKPKAADKPAVKTAKAADTKGDKAAKAKGKATPAATSGPTCRAEGCKQAVRAKGYCRKHFMNWRRGSVGDHHRYKICSKEACRKPRTKGGLCDEHAGVAAPADAAAPAAPPA
ncbi:MAG TPA: hypothetical protein VLC06_15005 [Polyangia bacterium]|jgi:hypothetical protein|nr:hypothetical protein [Polyangia bacterium]